MRIRRIVDYDRVGGEIYYRKGKFSDDPELMEAYECGYNDAIKEMEADGYHERRGNVTHWGGDGSRILYRHNDRDRWDDGDVEYRRRRDSRGRYL